MLAAHQSPAGTQLIMRCSQVMRPSVKSRDFWILISVRVLGDMHLLFIEAMGYFVSPGQAETEQESEILAPEGPGGAN